LEALAGLVFREQAVVYGAFAGVVDLVATLGNRDRCRQFQVVVDLVKQVAQVAVLR